MTISNDHNDPLGQRPSGILPFQEIDISLAMKEFTSRIKSRQEDKRW
jgi:hypothetical protein